MKENSVNRGTSSEDVGSEIKFAGNDNKDKMYEPKHKRKLVRVLTVIGYVFSVSLAAIMLSLFYIFIYNPWKPAGESQKYLGAADSNLLVSKHSFETGSLETNLVNKTFSDMEKEEPRALPLEVLKTTFLGKIKRSIKNKEMGLITSNSSKK